MLETIQPSDLKVRHRKMWASGDYPNVARRLIPRLGDRLVLAAQVGPGDRVLDVAAGSGNAAIPAAALGATVVASDLTPELFNAGRLEAASRGVELVWDVGDAESLPYSDSRFDIVMSCVGVMFAPHHQLAADEILRVVRPGGTIALLNWTPEGFIGQMLATLKPFAPAPPPGAAAPPLWGRAGYVEELFGDGVRDLTCVRECVQVVGFDSGAQIRDFFKANYGPVIAVYAALTAGAPERIADLDSALAELGDGHIQDEEMQWEYVIITAKRS